MVLYAFDFITHCIATNVTLFASVCFYEVIVFTKHFHLKKAAAVFLRFCLFANYIFFLICGYFKSFRIKQ